MPLTQLRRVSRSQGSLHFRKCSSSFQLKFMSISLVVLRFELADDCPSPKDLEFYAPGFCRSRDMLKSEEGEEKNSEASADNGVEASAIPEDKLKVHRGERDLHDMQLETLDSITVSEDFHTDNDQDTELYSSSRETETPDWSDEHRKEKRKIAFFSGNPTVEIVKGILHIYKNNEMTSLEKGVPRSQMICLLAVPSKMTCIDLMQFVAPSEEFIEQVKIIRDSSPNHYMVLVKFRNQELADDFYDTFNGHPFNSLEEEVCHLVYVAKVETMKTSQGASLPSTGLTELPKCPVCLERMDESVEGVLTILCNHSFHGSCLSKWSDTSCPVCRYSQTPPPVSENKCFECDSKESLWICLICGHIGCGRYLRLHAHRHFEETQHTYSLELESQRVWDYTGDNYVHRLVQNKTDGKLVQYVSGTQGDDEEKLDSLTLEYTYLLTSQLENQRLYFEGKMTQIEKDAAEQVGLMEERSKKTLEECKKLERSLEATEKEKKNLEKKYTQVVSKVGTLLSDLKDERELNKCLRENQHLWQEKVKELEAKSTQEVRELQEQVADLMKHFKMTSAIANAPVDTRQELQDGNLFVEDKPDTSSNSGRRHARRKHK